MIKVEAIKEADYDLYDDFIKKYKGAMLFHTIGYQKLLSKTLDAKIETVLVFDTEIIGVLPLMSMDGKFGKVYNSLPFYGSNGGVLAERQDAFDLLLNYFRTLVKSSGVALGMISNGPFDVKEKNKNFDIVENRNCQISNIEKLDNEFDLMQLFHTKTRNMVRKAMKSEISFSIDNNAIDFLYETHVSNMLNVNGIPKPKSFFDHLSVELDAGKDYNIYVAKKNGISISAVLLFYFSDTIEYYTPVIDVNYRDLQPNSFLIYQAMLEGAKKGYKFWNWGGTWETQVDLYRFKSRFGAKDYNYQYNILIDNKSIYESNPKELLAEYPFFYTLPFSSLNTKGDE